MEENIKNEEKRSGKNLFNKGKGIFSMLMLGGLFLAPMISVIRIKEQLKKIEKKYNVRNWKNECIGREGIIECRSSAILYKKFNRLLRESLYCLRTIDSRKIKGLRVSEEILYRRIFLYRNLFAIRCDFSTRTERPIHDTLKKSIKLMQECRVYNLKRLIEDDIKFSKARKIVIDDSGLKVINGGE